MSKTKTKESTLPRFTLRLVGRDGNAFMIMGLFQRGARAAGWSQEDVHKVLEEMEQGDYNNLLCVVMKYADVE